MTATPLEVQLAAEAVLREHCAVAFAQAAADLLFAARAPGADQVALVAAFAERQTTQVMALLIAATRAYCAETSPIALQAHPVVQ